MATSIASAAPIYDVEDDFSTSNPSGTWTYGQYGVLAGPVPDTTSLTPFNTYAPNYIGTPIDFWVFSGTDPRVTHNDCGAVYSNFGVAWQVNQFNVSPSGATYAGVRFTAPASSLYDLVSDFTNVQSNAAKPLYVYVNNVQVDVFSLTDTARSYNNPALPLTAGSIVDFVVGGGNNVAVDATFTPIPEPAWLALLGLGDWACSLLLADDGALNRWRDGAGHSLLVFR